MGHSYWKNLTKLSSCADIVIVGGGFIGLSVAYWIKIKRPNLSIIVLDSRELGEGASGRNAGFLTKGSLSFYEHLTSTWGPEAAQDIFNFAEESIALTLSHLPMRESSYASSFSLYSHDKEFVFKGFQKSSPLFKSKVCFESQNEASINPFSLLRLLEFKVQEEGVKILRGVECFGLQSKTLSTSLGEISGGEVVLALNGYTNSLIENVIRPQRAQMLCAEMNSSVSIPGLIYEPESRVYFKAVESHKIIIGGKRLIDSATEETSELGINAKIQDALEEYVTERIGKIKAINSRWSGIMGFSSDELPHVEKREDYYLISGFSGHGVGLGFNASRNLSDMMFDHSSSFFDSIRTTRCRVNKP